MKILLLHSDFIEFEPKQKAIKNAEVWKAGKKKLKECLVVFSAVEKQDESEPEQIVTNTAGEIAQVAKEVKCKRVLLYPYVHLTATPASPATALKVLRGTEQELKKLKFEVSHAPFGWYKAFNIKCKGHPLAELSRTITAIPGVAKKEDVISGALKFEDKVKSEFFILTPSSKLTPAKKFNFKQYENLEKFLKYEIAKVRGVPKEPPHAKLMRSLELADYEPGSDPGNLRYYPKGKLVKGLLEQWITDRVIKYGAMEVETPVMYDLEHPAIKDYLNRFPARQYIVESAKKKFFLRFSACFGQFLINKGMGISYKDLPMKMYELTRYSFRLEKAGELVALRRLRAFTMPDMHTLCQSLAAAREEFKNQFKLSMKCLAELGIKSESYETGIRFTKAFWAKNKSFITSLVKLIGKPVLIEIWNYRYAYFDPKFEFNFVDALDKASALSTVQIDHENAKRYGIKFTDKDNKKKFPLILHASPSGGIERCIYALLEQAWLEQKKGKNPTLPLWLAPTQVRLCSVSDAYNKYCESVADEIEKENIRIDVDDTVESVSKKIRRAEMEWIPLIVVIGEKEKKSGKLAVRFRETGKVKEMTKKGLMQKIKKQTEGMPFKKLTLPRELSKRPIFVG